MSTNSLHSPKKLWRSISKTISVVGILGVGLFVSALVLFVSKTGSNQWIQRMFATDSIQLWWYVTRASGLLAYFLLWLSTAWGLAVSSKIFDPFLERMFTYDFHEHLSLLGLGFALVHVVVLLFDRFLPFSLWQVLIPFIAPYRNFWVGIGIIAFYMSALVTITFYMRSRIGMSAFRKIHYLSLLAYVGVTFHGMFAGTDYALPLTQILYKGTMLVTLFLTTYWLVLLWIRRVEERRQKRLEARRRHGQKRSQWGRGY